MIASSRAVRTGRMATLMAAVMLALAAPLLLLAPTPSNAQEFTEEHLRLAARYAELSGANNAYVTALNAQRRDIIRAVGATNPDQVELITEVTDQAYLAMAERTGPLFENIAEVYASTFSEADLQAIVGFLETDAGRNWLENRRSADEAVFAATIAWGDTINPIFLDQVRTGLRERGLDF